MLRSFEAGKRKRLTVVVARSPLAFALSAERCALQRGGGLGRGLGGGLRAFALFLVATALWVGGRGEDWRGGGKRQRSQQTRQDHSG